MGSISLINALPNVVFPQPLSPTRPKVSPFKTEKLTSSTALNSFNILPVKLFFKGNQTFRFSTFSNATGASIGFECSFAGKEFCTCTPVFSGMHHLKNH